jgi:hypothetical protein
VRSAWSRDFCPRVVTGSRIYQTSDMLSSFVSHTRAGRIGKVASTRSGETRLWVVMTLSLLLCNSLAGVSVRGGLVELLNCACDNRLLLLGIFGGDFEPSRTVVVDSLEFSVCQSRYALSERLLRSL